MSGPAIHHIVAREFLTKALKSKYNSPSSAAFWNKMESGDNAPLYLLGAQWPDFLFFNINDWTPVNGVKTVAEACFDIMDFKTEFEKKVKEMIPQELWNAIDTLEQMSATAVERSATLSTISNLVGGVKIISNCSKPLPKQRSRNTCRIHLIFSAS